MEQPSKSRSHLSATRIESMDSGGTSQTTSSATTNTESSGGVTSDESRVEARERQFGNINMDPLPTLSFPSSNTHDNIIASDTLEAVGKTASDSIRHKPAPLSGVKSNLDKQSERRSSCTHDHNYLITSHISPAPRRIGQYEVLRTIGKGNFAVVKLAFHRILKIR